MCIDIANTPAVQGVCADKCQHFIAACDGCHGQVLQSSKYFVALLQAAQGELAQYQRVCQYLAFTQLFCQLRIAALQVVYLYRGVHQNHAGLRRGAASSSGSVPPNSARRRTLSRSISP